MTRLSIRRRLLLVVIATVAATITGLVAGFNLVLAHTLDRDARNLARARASAQLGLLASANGQLIVRDAPDDATADALVWVFSRRRTLERPPAGTRLDAAARALAGGPARFVDVPKADIRLASLPAVVDGRRSGTIVAGVSLAPYEDTRHIALVASAGFGGVLLLLVALASRWLVGSSLRPVHEMTLQAAAWSEHDLDHRFALGPPHDELTELAATLDQLLGRLAASLRREQRFSAELSHELRTPLARVLAECEVTLSHEQTAADYRLAVETIHRNATQLTRTVDALMAAARHESGFERGTADAYTVAVEAAESCTDSTTEQLDLTVQEPIRPIRIGVDGELGQRILVPLIDNARRYGARSIKLSIEGADGIVRYVVDDDGPGLDEAELEHIFEPGVRGAAAEQSPSGAGLGLALARRLARSVSGDVVAAERGEGARFIVTLPDA